MKVKPFVILTGNSGTGKTKLAQLFAKYMENDVGLKDKQKVSTEVSVGKSGKNRGWSISRKDCLDLIPKQSYEDYFSTKIDGIDTEAKLNLNLRLFFKSNKDLEKHLEQLADENPKQKINIDLELPESVHKGSSVRYKVVPVGANWTENRNIVGYYNVITNKYQSTPAYELIKDSNGDENNPYFLILDEMNLSHVERYFADFLSAIESGESIPLYGLNKDLELGSNLFIIGTVNVDETTYMFSPKVLDRANTIEFDTYSASDYMSGEFNSEPPQGDIEYLNNPLSDKDLNNLSINELKDILDDVNVNGEKLWKVLSLEIDKFQSTLKEAGFDFGFRVINEIIKFMIVAWKYEGEPENWTNWQRYFDAQIKQKMLPKVHGPQRKIESTLKKLYDLCLIDSGLNNPSELTEVNTKYFDSALKLQEMINVLKEQRFVSFIN